MSIENLIAENTAAIKALTDAINRLTVPRGGAPVPAVASAPVPAVVSAPVPAVASAPVPAVVSAPVPAVASAPVPAVASAPVPAVAPAPVPAVAPAPALTLDVVRSACVRGGAAGITAEIVGFLGSCGVRNLNELDPAKYPDLMAFLASKGVN